MRAASDKAQADEARVQTWLEIREPLERQLAPLGRAAIDRLDLRGGEHVLDIGPGIGGTPAFLAHQVGTTGSVVAIDILSSAVALMRRETSDAPNLSFLHGDAQLQTFKPGSFDGAFSRFGVMFFSDPVAAFANIRRALRPAGQLAFVCWRQLEENELDALPLRLASPELPPEIVGAAADARHFAFADVVYLRDLLNQTGYVEIDIRPHDASVTAGSLRELVAICARVGSLGTILRAHPRYRRDAIAALEQGLAPRDGPAGPSLRAASWVVHARTPASAA